MEQTFYLLLAILIPLSVVVFILTEFDILHPVSIVTFVMTASAFLAATKIEQWHLPMSINASLLIVTSLICFITGGLWVDWRIKKNLNGIPVKKDCCEYFISNSGILLMSLTVLLLAYFQYREFYDGSVMLGNHSGPFDFSSMIKTIRPSVERETFKFSRWFFYRFYFVQGIVFCSLFVFFTRSIQGNYRLEFRRNMKYLIPLLFSLVFLLCDTGRKLPLDFLLFCLLTGAIIFQIRNHFSVKGKLYIILVCAVCGLFFLMVFLALGTLSGKVSAGGQSFYEILVHYMGLSMPAFSVFLEQVRAENPYIGSTTLFGIYSNLNRLGAGLPPVRLFQPFVYFKGVDTNVYTMMARYITDYGFIGMHLIMAFIGMFYAAFYDYIRFISKKTEWIAYYGYLPFTLFFAMNEEHFLIQVLTTATLYNFVLFYLVFKVFVHRTATD
ncbi:O-antigen polymerase [uncultured Succiniclasticum sp.]|uniref:O-antigen polymerase n=1 Tax=uncultured Succiniclasticum sp. TaxID=1500547 RepID=UPI0025F81B70|nr:O-antigen polymerase [uncultured Succiniclasticum sp.]